MYGQKPVRLTLLGIATLLVIFSVAFVPTAQTKSIPGSISLAPPAFVDTASAAADADIVTRLDEEAGISAYVKSPSPINLSQAKTVFRTVETQTDQYIIGSVAVPGYPEHYDTHVYVSADGWILSYYMRTSPGGKMLDILNHSVTNTNLQAALAVVGAATGISVAGVQYYDFRFPNATHILVVYEDDQNGDSFSITLPADYIYSEFTYAYAGGERITIDGEQIEETFQWDAGRSYGPIPASRLNPGTPHLISSSWNVDHILLMITYRVP